MALDQDTSWFLAQLKPNCAEIAVRNLRQQGLECFLPTVEKTTVKQRRFVATKRALFPGYVFVALDVTKGLWRKVNSTYGITKLVSFGPTPTQVPRGLVEQIKLRCDPDSLLLETNAMRPGDRARITTGPFANYIAEIEKIDSDRRIWVLMDIMGGQTRVAVKAKVLGTL